MTASAAGSGSPKSSLDLVQSNEQVGVALDLDGSNQFGKIGRRKSGAADLQSSFHLVCCGSKSELAN